MKIYISADMEGVTGVTHSQEVIPGRSQSERFRGLLTADVNAAIEGAAQAGATEFLVNEAHDGMRNILLEDLDPRAEVIVGQRKPYSMMQGFEGAGLVFFVGYHARAGTEGVLSHTFDSPTVVTGVWLNGEPCSEALMNATLIGLKGIPVGLVTDDDLARAEAESLYAGVQTARVKTAVDRYTARCLSPQAARERIREAAPRAAGKGDLTPYAPEPPYSFTIEFATASSATSVLFFPAWSAWTTGASHGSTRTTKRPSRCSSASCGCPAATLTTVRRNREPRLLHRGRLRRREIRGQPARRRSWRLRLAR